MHEIYDIMTWLKGLLGWYIVESDVINIKVDILGFENNHCMENISKTLGGEYTEDHKY